MSNFKENKGLSADTRSQMDRRKLHVKRRAYLWSKKT